MGQLHDDIEEVEEGKIIMSVFVRPKLYIDVIIGKNKDNGKVVVVNHIRAKGILLDEREKLAIK